MSPRVFVSYSSPDAVKADAIRAALEAAGIACWIAPRDLSAGTQWGAGIVQAIEACEAIVVVFSNAANASPQVAREMELAVSRRRPLIPIRIADDMPTDDMQYFLGVSHWFNAFAAPIETYLPDIVIAVQRVLARERKPWTELQRRMPKTRGGQIVLAAAGAAALAIIVALLMRGPPYPTMAALNSPLAGRWETKMPDAGGGQADCVMDVQKSGLATYSDDCPTPLTGSSGTFMVAKDATWSPTQFKPGDSGSFLLEGGTANGATGAYKLGWFGGLTTRDAHFGTLSWRHASNSQSSGGGAASVMPTPATWPLADTPAVVQRATTYVRSKWRPDAVLMSVGVKPDPSGGTDAAFTFYSPGQQQVMVFEPGSQAGAMTPPSAAQEDVSQAIPAEFLDLPAAIDRAHQAGMQGKQISGATLEWTGGDSCGTGNFRIDNAILPKCQPGRFIGIQWAIASALGERDYIPATN